MVDMDGGQGGGGGGGGGGAYSSFAEVLMAYY